jgi:hypothetical protein
MNQISAGKALIVLPNIGEEEHKKSHLIWMA